jgi:hypothetical protein
LLARRRGRIYHRKPIAFTQSAPRGQLDVYRCAASSAWNAFLSHGKVFPEMGTALTIFASGEKRSHPGLGGGEA